jgi:lipopolysaccharide export system protein LptA
MTSKHQRLIFCAALTLGLFNLYTPLGLSQPTKDKIHPKDSSPPIEITSDRMRSENGGQKIIFSGNVSIKKTIWL